jgi:hypothetical protein
VPTTALNHFQQDIARARTIVAHASPLPNTTPPEQLLRSDLLRSSWMFGVGALDAYFCDAYTDIVAATIIAKSRHSALVLPEFFQNIRFPVRAILEPYTNNVNWRWRMAARQMMERENVLTLAAIQTLFNKFFRNGQKFFSLTGSSTRMPAGVSSGSPRGGSTTSRRPSAEQRSQMPGPEWKSGFGRSSSGDTTASTTATARV